MCKLRSERLGGLNQAKWEGKHSTRREQHLQSPGMALSTACPLLALKEAGTTGVSESEV